MIKQTATREDFSFSDVAPHPLAALVFWWSPSCFSVPFFWEEGFEASMTSNNFWARLRRCAITAMPPVKKGSGADAMFSGMPAYLINLDWSDGAVSWVKRVGGLFLPHPVVSIFWAFVSYYILLLAFRCGHTFTIAGALAFGLSSFIIIGWPQGIMAG